MKKFLIVILVLVLLLGGYTWSQYNTIIGTQELVVSQESQVKNMFERRLDLIPNMAKTVKGYADHEKGTFTGVAKLRSSSQELETLNKLIEQGKVTSVEVSNQVSSLISGLKVTMEAYPQLKADTQFSALLVELEGSENRIRVEIKNYNDKVAEFNTLLLRFPGNIIASWFHFAPKERINPPADKEIKKVPDVSDVFGK